MWYSLSRTCCWCRPRLRGLQALLVEFFNIVHYFFPVGHRLQVLLVGIFNLGHEIGTTSRRFWGVKSQRLLLCFLFGFFGFLRFLVLVVAVKTMARSESGSEADPSSNELGRGAGRWVEGNC